MINIHLSFLFFICLALFSNTATAVYPSEQRNPFEYGNKTIKKIKQGDSLEVILISEDKKIAVIGGKEYSIGDKLGRFMVMTIDIDYVDIASSLKTKRLYLNDQL